jgi:serine/threonine protein phosphatase PrpC
MGCGSSSRAKDPAQQEKQPSVHGAAASGAVASPAPVAVAAEAVAGAVKSAEEIARDAAEDAIEKEKLAAQQRRRLSVNPAHVGDTEGEHDKDGSTKVLTNNDIDFSKVVGSGQSLFKANKDLRVATKSKKGYVPFNRDKVNQDRPIVAYDLTGNEAENVCLFGCLDGHGEFGHKVSQFVQDHLAVELGKQPALTTSTTEAIIAGVGSTVQMLKDLKEPNKINCSFSGTTCVFSILHQNKLYNANIGDSRAVLCRASKAKPGAVEACDLTEDHKPELESEAKRILACGGRIDTLPGPPDEDCGPQRVWLKDVDVPGLAMTRSIGDNVAGTVGVIQEPEVRVHEVDKDDYFVIWASDGVWEFISSQEAVALVYEYRHDYKEACDKLVDESVKRWQQEEEVVDDITCVIVQLNAPPAQ